MGEYIEYVGVRWHRRKDGYYAYSRKGLLHRYIWEQHNGPIPPGYHVHHRDHDKSNNAIDNLVALLPGEHARVHPGRDVAAANSAAGKLGGKARQHPELRKPQSASRNPSCKYCDEPVTNPHGNAKYCDRHINIHDRMEKRECTECGQEFECHFYSTARHCDESCRNKAKWREVRTDHASYEERVCCVCG